MTENTPEVFTGSDYEPGPGEYRLRLAAFANVFRLVGNAAVVLLLPVLLATTLSHERYAVWAFSFSVAAYIGYFDLGLTTTIAAFVGETALGNVDARAWRVFTIAARMMAVFAALLAAVFVPITILAPEIVSSMRPAEVATSRETIALLAIGNLALLGSVVPMAFFAGLGKVLRVSVTSVLLRLLGVSVLAGLVVAGASLPTLAGAFAVSNVAVLVASGLLVARERPRSLIDGPVDRQLRDSFKRQSYGMMRWSTAMFLVTGLDTVLVSVLKFTNVGSYALALAVSSALAGGDNAVLAALLPRWANDEAGGKTLVTALGFAALPNALLLTASGVMITLLGHITATATGNTTLFQSLPYLYLLVGATVIRQVGSPLAMAFAVRRKARQAFLGPASEAVVNAAASIILGIIMGPIGVAIGTLGGAVVGLVCIVVHTAPTHLQLGRSFLVKKIVVGPLAVGMVAAVPIIAVANVGGTVLRVTLLVPAVALAVWALARLVSGRSETVAHESSPSS